MLKSTCSAATYYNHFREQLEATANPRIADGQAQYMKNRFVFFGAPATVRQPLAKAYYKTVGVPEGEVLLDVLELCFADDHREIHYFAIETLEKAIKTLPKEGIKTLTWLITTNSWWDSVDAIAPLVGIHFQKYPDLILPTTETWMSSSNMWLQRVAIIFQLRYRNQTNTSLLFKYILQVAHSKEFFLQKAAGWALREHSKWDAAAVIHFIENHQLAPLTKREGLKWIGNIKNSTT
jgi:3-methyladenine DNA glycosylase AlkD